MPRAEAPPPAGDKIDFAATQQEAERLDARLNPWVFAISQNKYDSMTRRLEDLLKPVEESEPAAAPDQPDGPVESTGPEPALAPPEAVELGPASGTE